MIRISARPLFELAAYFEASKAEIPHDYANKLFQAPKTNNDDVPNVALEYGEISEDELAEIIGFAGIHKSNHPVGIDCDGVASSVIVNDVELALLYPISGLENFIRKNRPPIAHEFDRAGSMDAYAEV